jgi:transcriptional regulator with XRE-family HTH domain
MNGNNVVNLDGMRELLSRGMTKEYLLREIGCSRPALNRWLKGTPPKSELMTREINRTVARLLNRDDRPSY